MLKKLLPLLLLFCFAATAQTTPIPDANFEQFLVDQGIDTNGVNGNILDVDAQAVTNLNITRNDITDFDGLEAFVNLVTLNAGTNQFLTLPLNTLTILEELTFRNNQVLASLDLSQNLALKEFEIRASSAAPIPTIPSLDFSQNLALEKLDVSVFESITSLTFPVTTTLTDIDIAQLSVPVIDLSLLEGDIDFRIVGSRVDVNIIYPNLNTALKRLELSSIDFPTVDVSPMIGLERFELSSTSTESFQLPNTNTLTSIRIWGHEINVPVDLSIVPELTTLDIRNNYGSTPLEVDLTTNIELTSVSLPSNLMNSVDLTQNTKITRLDVSRNNLTAIDVTNNTLLNTFDANNNQLPTIDLSQNLELEYLRLHFNQFPSLDVTNNPELYILNIGNNLFTGTGLDLTQNPELGILYANDNQIESLDIDQNPALRFLDISYNIFPGNDIINDFYDKIVVKANLSDVYFKANNNLLTGAIPDFYSIYTDNDPSTIQHRRWWFNIENNYFHFGDFENQHLDLISLLTTQSIGPSPDVVMREYTYAPQEKVNAIETPTRNAGESITLTTTVRGSQNHYTWFKDGVEMPDAPDSPELILNDLNTCDAGVYYAEITSDLVPFENSDPPGTDGKNLLLVRNDITLTVNATKECVTLDMPLTNVPINSGLQWNDTPGACGYKINVGTTSGATDVVNDEDVGEVTVYNFATDLNTNQDYFVTITPYYDDGDFTPCAEESFRTNASTVAPDCTTLSSSTVGNMNVSADLPRIEWNPANGADEYDITISSPSGNNDITTTTNETFINLSNSFTSGEVVTVTIIPSNGVGNAVGPCTSQSFTIQGGTPQPPLCTTLDNPNNNDTDVAVDLSEITWNAATNATQYRITIDGSTSNTNDETDLIVTGTSHTFANNFDNGETVTVTIVPLNGTVEPATTCSPETFTIVAADPTSNAFITTWETTTANETITIPTRPFFGTYDYTVDWGDGVIDNNVAGDITHTYTTSGIQTISITGTFPQIHFNGTAVDRDKILTIEQWGDIQWQALTQAFKGCSRLTITNPSIDNPDLSNVTDISEAFADCTNFNGDITLWNVVTVTNMVNLFQRANSFNQDIGDWNVSNVIAMDRVFEGAAAFNQDIGDWDVSSVTRMPVMFTGADNFDQDIGMWNVSNVTDMNTMFAYATSFNQDIGNWNVSNVTNMDQMFLGATAFNQDISFKAGMGVPSGDAWNISNITSMVVMFSGASSFNQDISNWDVTNVTNMSQTFRDATSFDQDLSDWNVSNVNNAGNMFTGVTLSTANYDALLISWNVQSLQSNVPFSGGNSQYCEGESARTNMTTSDLWTINDGGLAGPTVDDLADQTQANSYTLPTIAGTQLSGTEAYYTETDGGGTRYDANDVIDFADFPAYPVTLFIYDGNGSCSSEESFQLILTNSTPTVPDCTSLVAPGPLENEMDVAIDISGISWNSVSNATGYKLAISSTSGNNNLPLTDVNNVLTHSFSTPFQNEDVVTVTIIPYNDVGDATGPCADESFTIVAASSSVPECTSLVAPGPANNDIDVVVDISSISWNSVNGATGYKLGITSTSGNNDLPLTDMNNALTHQFAMPFQNGDIVVVTLIPYNAVGDATGPCMDESFTIVSTTQPNPPSCSPLTTPMNNETGVSINSTITWEEADYAEGYRLTIRTELDEIILEDEDVGLLTSFTLPEELPYGTTVYVATTPYNEQGDAASCSEQSFTTEEEPMVPEIEDETKYGFSPDGDGINEYWHIDNIEDYPENVVTIYNRWGDAVFRIENYDNASEVFRGDANLKTKMGAGRLPTGTYFFDIQIEGETILQKTKGYVVIKR